jgi:hypothetical protein
MPHLATCVVHSVRSGPFWSDHDNFGLDKMLPRIWPLEQAHGLVLRPENRPMILPQDPEPVLLTAFCLLSGPHSVLDLFYERLTSHG